MIILDTLADKRRLCRLPFAHTAQIKPGQYLRSGAQRLPLLRHDTSQGCVDVVLHPETLIDSTSLTIAGQSIESLGGEKTLLITHNDGLFCALHALFLLPSAQRKNVFVIAQFEHALPFYACPSRMYNAALPPGIIAALPLLEDWGVFNRIVHPDAPGCFDGEMKHLAQSFPAVEREILLK